MNQSNVIDHQKQVFLNPNTNLPKTYFQLMEKVGSQGKYQRNIFLIFLLVFLVTGSILLSTSFLFLNNRYQCGELGLLTTECKKLICQISDLQERKKYFLENQESITSVATQYGPFMCEDQFLLDMIKSCPYFGSLLGFIVFSYISDNFGRRTTMIITLSVATLGCFLISTGFNLGMIVTGVVLAGAGINSSSGMCFVYLAQTVQNIKRQKYSILIQVAYTVGAMILTGLYYFIQNWRAVSVILQTLPILITLFIFVFYVQETPTFLLKKSDQVALKALNRIGYINFKVKDILSTQDIDNVRSQQLAHEKFDKKKVSPLDLIRFRSLRSTTILGCLLCYIVFSMYYGPSLIIDTIGFNMFVSNLAILTSELIGYIPCYLYVDKVKRKTANVGLFVITIFSSLVLTFVQKPQDCEMCVESIIQLIIIFIFRFAVAIEFVFFLVYVIQLFPSRIVGIGNGVISIAGTMASTLSPIILGALQRIEFNLFLLFLILGIIGVCGSILLDETYGKPIKAQIDEVLFAKNKRKTQYISEIQSGQIINSKQQN